MVTKKQRGSVLLAVLLGALIIALGAMVLSVTMQYNLKAARNQRLNFQADMLAESATEEFIAYLRGNSGAPSAGTTEWNVNLTPNTLTLGIATITATANIFYREVNAASYLSADKAYYGFSVLDNQSDVYYDVFSFGVVQDGSQDSIVQKYKKVFKSTTGVTVNFFVETSENRPYLLTVSK